MKTLLRQAWRHPSAQIARVMLMIEIIVFFTIYPLVQTFIR